MKNTTRWMSAAFLLATSTTLMAAPRDGLVVRLSTPAPVLRGDVDVVVNLSVTNTTREAITVLRWELPSDRLQNQAFRITRDGVPVRYTGALVKRAAPTAEDYVRIEAGATLNYAVELTGTYDLSRNGTYAIEYTSKGAADAGELRSQQPLYVWLESRTGLGAPAARAAVDPGVGPITYTGNCSATRQTQLQQAVTEALNYSNNAVTYFNTYRAATQRYVTWFGQPTKQRFRQTVQPHFVAIQDAFANKPLTLDCSCTQSYYAYVYPDQPYKIYLCNAFWSAPMLGTDSKAGTLIHEMSHFTVVAGTDDYVYGQSGARALAISNPNQAVMNADSHEYFAENTPAQP